ncbi:MAG: GAF domain-containing protein [Actinophytocola sp.]|uniref:GAF domain-containing sensor histidine kinase n=1 Tax=Actinophytocola sp. TaxID=1872138 RepID=UPI0013241037|nr:GAF domain-containing sensor histidine kinase [Actinophytocola sp.]MPZ80321.1 GAF domain-containing protein [Actinophytocola sp.]
MAGFDRDELREVSAAVLAVTAHLSVRDVLRTILTSARKLVGARYAALGLPDGSGGFAEFLADGISDEEWAAIGPLPRTHGLLAVMLCDPNPVRLTNIRDHPHFRWWPAAHPELTDFLGMPIMDGDEFVGEVFLANSCNPGGFTDDDEELMRLLAAHAAIAIVNARLYERSRELSIVEERSRIARELHDAVTQKLFSLRLTADAASALLYRDPARAAAELATVRKLAAEATEELRAIVVDQRPADLRGDGLDIALRKQAELLDRVHEPTIRYTTCQCVPPLTEARQQAVYRIAQEAMHNALRHAGATRIDMSLVSHKRKVVLEVRDDGAGFDPATADAAGRRLGLSSMRERARVAGGKLDVTSEAGRGTTVRLEVPTGG